MSHPHPTCPDYGHNLTLPSAPACPLGCTSREVRTCACCHSTCDVPTCPRAHRRNPIWQRVKDGHDVCGADVPLGDVAVTNVSRPKNGQLDLFAS